MRFRAERLRRANANNERFRRALRGADFHVIQIPRGEMWVSPQTPLASACMPLKRILTFDELQLVLQRFHRNTRRFAVLMDPDAVVLGDYRCAGNNDQLKIRPSMSS